MNEDSSLNNLSGGSTSTAYKKLANICAFTALFVFAVVYTVLPASLNQIASHYHANGAMLGSIFRYMMIGFFVATLLAGGYSDKYGKVPLITIGCFLMAVGAVIFGLRLSFGVTILAAGIVGIGGGISEGNAMALIADLANEKRKTAMLNWGQVAYGVGASSAPLAIAIILKTTMYWPAGFYMAAVVCAIAGLIGLKVLMLGRETPRAAVGEKVPYREFFTNPLVLCLCAGMMLYVGAESGISSWLAVYFKKDVGTAAAAAASSVALFWIGITIGRALTTGLSKHFSDSTIICVGLGCGFVCITGLLLVHNAPAAFIITLISGFFFAPVWPTILGYAGKEHPQHSGSLFGILVACGTLGVVVFPPLIGKIADSVGMRQGLWLVSLALIANFAIFLGLRFARRNIKSTTA